jgi:hypothetical protein
MSFDLSDIFSFTQLHNFNNSGLDGFEFSPRVNSIGGRSHLKVKRRGAAKVF